MDFYWLFTGCLLAVYWSLTSRAKLTQTNHPSNPIQYGAPQLIGEIFRPPPREVFC
jgi:hypothetical protein